MRHFKPCKTIYLYNMKPIKKPKQFFALWRNKKGNFIQFYTDCEILGFKKSVLNEGTLYIDTRYQAKLRLYNYLVFYKRVLAIQN